MEESLICKQALIRSIVSSILRGENVDAANAALCDERVQQVYQASNASERLLFYWSIGGLFARHIPNQIKGYDNIKIPAYYMQSYQETICYMEDFGEYCCVIEKYSKLCSKVDKLLSFLNRPGIALNSDGSQALSIKELGLSEWNKYLNVNTVKDVAKSVIIEVENMELVGKLDKRQQMIIRTINSFITADEQTGHGIYEQMLEEPLLRNYAYRFKFIARKLKDSTNGECITQFLNSLNVVGEVASRFMPRSKRKILMTASEAMTQLRFKDYLEFCDKEDNLMIGPLTEYNFNNSLILFNFSDVAQDKLFGSYAQYLNSLFNNVCDDLTNERLKNKEMFKKIIHIHQKQISRMFFVAHDKRFTNVIEQALNNTLVLCRNFGNLPQLLADYCHDILMKAMVNVDKRRWENKLSGIVSIFRKIDDKDAFLAAYWKWLACRLVYVSSVLMMNTNEWTVDAELIALDKLRRIYDNVDSWELKHLVIKMKEYHKQWHEKNKVPKEFNALIVATNVWPLMVPQSNFRIPQQLLDHTDDYAANFDNKNAALIWVHSFATCELNLNFGSGTYVLHTSVHVMTILDLFNSSQSLNFTEISTATDIPVDHLLMFMKMIVNSKLLLCDAGVTTESNFKLNEEFISKEKVLRILPPLREATEDEQDLEAANHLPARFRNNNQVIDQAIVQVIDQAIVQEAEVNREPRDTVGYLQALVARLIRARGQMTREELITEVIDQSADRYTPPVESITRTIDRLTELGLMEKVDEVYRYLP